MRSKLKVTGEVPKADNECSVMIRSEENVLYVVARKGADGLSGVLWHQPRNGERLST